MEKKEIFKKWGIPVGSAMIVLSLILSGWLLFFNRTFSLTETAYLYIDADDTADSVQARIERVAQPGISCGFPLLAKFGKYEVKTGRYAVEPDDHMLSLFRRLNQGRQTPINLTIPNARTMEKLAGVLGKKLMIDSTEIARNLTDSVFCRRYGYDTVTIPCLFIPNTYEVYWNISMEEFMQRMEKENRAFWTPERLDKSKAIGMTPNEVMTLASIVDSETANNGEKPMVAGMYVNRLHKGIPLQADPTVIFALRDFSLRRVYHNHLKVESPYNTYRNKGLPPGPIRIPSIAGIDAVLNHVEHNYLFMCAKEDFSGTHNFARTYREHLANAAKYTRALNQRGIK